MTIIYALSCDDCEYVFDDKEIVNCPRCDSDNIGVISVEEAVD